MPKIKLFLGAYINATNAQNLNCRAIAYYINKEQFEVKTMIFYSGDLSVPKLNGVSYLLVKWPHQIYKYLIYLRGLFWCDIAYLPKRELTYFVRILKVILRKKAFSTVEGIFNEENLKSSLEVYKTRKKLLCSFKGFDKLYSITHFLKDYNEYHLGIQTEDIVLYLGTDAKSFLNENKSIAQLINVIYIGRILRRKGVFEIIELSKQFQNLHFYVVGEGGDEEAFKNEAILCSNIQMLGRLNHFELSNLLEDMHLHFFPSRSEGFPKVTLETACAGVPSVVYPDYGATEWIAHKKNGFICANFKETKDLIQELIDNPHILQSVSKNAIDLGKSFDWKLKVKDWELEILKIICKECP